ncbi:MAG: acetyl-CoA carboxylase carboxyltransferase subunit alpha [Candidatus Bipolaricaulota bacterium]
MEKDKLLKKLESQIAELQELANQNGMDLSEEISRLRQKLKEAEEKRKSEITDWDRVQLARHPNRPTAKQYIDLLMDDFYQLHGDRLLGDDRALIGGLAKFEGTTVVLIAQQKGGEVEESKDCNFGMVHPEGYRKARRLMQMAARFDFPLISLIDTPGAYPGKSAEKRNIGGTIAKCIDEMLKLPVPTISAIIGEGGSGGAVAIGAADRVVMLENAIYSVISPEGCAAILWKDREKAEEAAKQLRLTAPHIFELGLIDEVVEEGSGGAHEDLEQTAKNLGDSLRTHLDQLLEISPQDLTDSRRNRYRKVGRYEYVEKD